MNLLKKLFIRDYVKVRYQTPPVSTYCPDRRQWHVLPSFDQVECGGTIEVNSRKCTQCPRFIKDVPHKKHILCRRER
jgi:hypothetical protein